MKVIITGARNPRVANHIISEAIEESGFDVTEVVSGGALGVDSCAEAWAKESSVPYKIFRPKLSKFGLAAGSIRNRRMAEYADALIALPRDGDSRGTKSMIQEANNLNLPVYIKELS